MMTDDILSELGTVMADFYKWFSAPDQYEQRKIDRYESGDLLVSTARVNDAAKPYETAISHPEYHSGHLVIVQTYDTPEQAQDGHNRWVATMTDDELPLLLEDVSLARVATLYRKTGGGTVFLRGVPSDE